MAKTRFRQIDVERLLKAGKALGYAYPSVQVDPDGTLRLITSGSAGTAADVEDPWGPVDDEESWAGLAGNPKRPRDAFDAREAAQSRQKRQAPATSDRDAVAAMRAAIAPAAQKILRRIAVNTTADAVKTAFRGRRSMDEGELAELAKVSVDELREAALAVPWFSTKRTGPMQFNELAALVLTGLMA